MKIDADGGLLFSGRINSTDGDASGKHGATTGWYEN